MIKKITEELFRRYVKVQLRGDYNMVTQAIQASEAAMLPYEVFIYIRNNYSQLTKDYPNIYEEEKEVLMYELNLENICLE